MNISYNQRYQSTEEKIQKALFSLLRIRKYGDILIKEICYEAGVNRSSFYAHYQDINDLMMKTEQQLSFEMSKIFSPDLKWDEQVFIRLFDFLYKNKDFYKAYLESEGQSFMERKDFYDYIKIIDKRRINCGFDNEERIYHMAFFAGGIKAMAKSWLKRGCVETPEQMAKILTNEYKVNSRFFDD